MSLLVDTNIIVYLAKDYSLQLLRKVNPDKTKIFVSVVTIAELRSLAIQNYWGKRKLELLGLLLDEMVVVEINENLIDTYAQIDSYSQCKNPSFTTHPHITPRNMGKNDLWIAATAALLGLTLITTDKDFEHLHNAFFDVKQMDVSIFKI